jgi:hypothetical protein
LKEVYLIDKNMKKNKNIKKIILVLGIALLTLFSFAQNVAAAGNVTETRTLRNLADLFVSYLNIGIELIIALAVVTFIWNVYLYFFTEQKDRAEAGKYVAYSVIGFFVILSLWGLVALLRNTINLPNQRPSFPFGGSTNSGGGNNGGGGFLPDAN